MLVLASALLVRLCLHAFKQEHWVGFQGSIEINLYGLYKDYIGFVLH